MSKPDEHFSYRHPAQVQPHIQASRRYDLISKHADKQQQKTHVLHLETVPYQLRQQTHISKINQKKNFLQQIIINHSRTPIYKYTETCIK